MANNDNKVSCRSGRTRLIDPNSFQGQSSSSNIPVQLEDLNISVQLETYKKGRSVLISGQAENRVENNKTLKISFIEGQTLPSGKKALTTKFTDLTTVFEKGEENNDEVLGITSIDIDFNSAYAPLVTINFIDVRGGAIFQNDENIKNGTNKYATFFELPYPLYRLKIKGYYGKPVTYCLHMTKFNTKFNSQTGNFEITASFIGYTYAMLSDMLMGFLKAIPYTVEGKEYYKSVNDLKTGDGKQILTISEFIAKISTINEGLSKISSNSPNAKNIENIDEKLNKLTEIKYEIYTLGYSLEQNFLQFDSRETYPIILRPPQTTNVDDLPPAKERENAEDYDLRKIPESDFTPNTETRYKFNSANQQIIDGNDDGKRKNAIDTAIDTYENKVNKLIEEYNKIGGESKLDFKSTSPEHFFSPLTKNEFDENLRTQQTDNILKQTLSAAPDTNTNPDYTVFDFKVKQYNEILFRDYQELAGDKKFGLHDMTYAYNALKTNEEILNANRQKFLKELASEVDAQITDKLGFSPTIKNIVEIFTTAVEAFVKTIYSVSYEAEKNTERKPLLLKVFGDNPSQNSDLINNQIIYPWPDYAERTEIGYIEKYLGDVSVIKSEIGKVPELDFIDRLLKAFIDGEKAEQDLRDALITQDTNWIPVNPLDTKIFSRQTPYERLGNDKSVLNKVIAMILTRALTFLGYSNKNLSVEDIQKMASFESNLISKLPDDKIKTALSNKSIDEILKTTVDINNQAVSVLKTTDDGSTYYYNLLFDGSAESKKLIPISYKNITDWDKNKTYTFGQTNNYFSSGSLYFPKNDTFLTNYSSEQYGNNDGGLYVQILSKSQYETSKASLIEEVNTDSVILLDKIKVQNQDEINSLSANLTSAGYNTFGGAYGIQEFSNMNFGDDTDLNGLPLMYVFYGDSFINDNRTLNNGLGFFDLTLDESDYKFPRKGDQNSLIEPLDIETGEFLDDPSRDGRKGDFIDFGKNRTIFNRLRQNSTDNNYTYPFINQEMYFKTVNSYYRKNYSFSLFGSLWYYSQNSEFTKALLFLNTLPFNNTIVNNNYNQLLNNGGLNTFPNNSIEAPEIIRLFDQKSGFIRAPRLWVAYIGGLLWRAEQASDTIIWKNEDEYVCPGISSDSQIPNTTQYFKVLNFDSGQGIADLQININPILLGLPSQIKEEFKRVFFDFVTGADTNVYTSWPTLKNSLEIWDKTTEEFKTTLDNMYTNANDDGSVPYNKGNFFQFKNLENYNIVTINKKNEDNNFRYTLFLELYGNYGSNETKTGAPKLIINAMMEEVVIANNNYKIWQKASENQTEFSPITVNSEALKLYISAITSTLAVTYENPESQKKQLEEKIFSTTNENVIKLQLYRTCKNIYDKWIGGVTDKTKLFYQCHFDEVNESETNRRNSDFELAKKLKTSPESLINSFRFVSRSFSDIGDKFYINPIPIADIIAVNPNSSFYDIVSRILADNNFDFIALPTYIDYNDENAISDVFTPKPSYEDTLNNGTCGPSFVCVYVGQTSKNLDFNNNPESYYANDGFDVRCLNGAIIDSGIPEDFKSSLQGYEDPVTMFAVNFSQQNQNIFKDVILDQSEFSETAESLKITDDISTKGAQNNRSLAGQNLYNVYSVRSYKAEIEMMGNAMIQPMMYFQLNNIPMFHGAYMITHVKHAIKPNYMSTHFTGVRIKKAETPLLTAKDLYMKLLEGLGFESTGEVDSGNYDNYITAYYSDLTISLPANKIIEGSTITNKVELTNRAIQELANWQNGSLNEDDGVEYLDKYAEVTPGFSGEDYASNKTPWSATFISYIMLAGDPNFPKSTQHYQYVTSAMKGNNGYEAFPLYSSLSIKAEVGDLFCRKREGKYTNSHCDVVYKVENNVATLVGGNLGNRRTDNTGSVRETTITLVDGFVTDDVKTSYQIVVKKTDNKYYNGKSLINASISLSNADNEIPSGDNPDYWSLVAVCALESVTDQGRCDVAQSIYNRLLSKLYKANTIKELIISEGQYEPVGRAMNEFKQISSKETAIKAVMKSNKYDYDVSNKVIEKTQTALNNSSLVESSKNFIGGRTDFISTAIRDRDSEKRKLERSSLPIVERDNQIFGCFVGPGAINYGKTNPPAANKPDFSGVTV
jgi:hypothetical protein